MIDGFICQAYCLDRSTFFMKTGAIIIVAVAVWTALAKATAATYSLDPVADVRAISFLADQNVNFFGDFLSVYTVSSENNTQRTFIQFDLSAIATNQQVESATLTLTASTGFGNNNTQQPMEVYRVLSPWTETGLTWLNRDTTHPWVTPGGDFVGTNGQPYAVSTLAATNNQPVTWDVTKLVQEWVTHPATNCGLALISHDGNRLTFSQRQAAAGLRPNLMVVVDELPPVHAYSSGGQVVLWWTGTNGVLQEKTNLNPAAIWGDSGRPVNQSSGSNSVTISAPAGNNFFRLRQGP
jgi:hypothetical protein